jgi:hypothetical protein
MPYNIRRVWVISVHKKCGESGLVLDNGIPMSRLNFHIFE